MKQYYLGILALLIAMVSCQDNFENAQESINEEKQSSNSNYKISVEDALANLEDFMKDEQIETRSGSKRRVKSIYPLRSTIATRSADLDSDDVIYVANFEDEEGYAILAADERISEKILAVIENGSLSQEEAYDAIAMASEVRPIFDGYPLDGPGFFTTEETGDEVFMNPNTVDLYDSENDDYMIGNMDMYDDTDLINSDEANLEEESQNVETRSGNNSQAFQTDSQLMVFGLCWLHAKRSIVQHSDNPEDDPGPGTPNKGYRTSTVTGPWSIAESVSPMLPNFSSWDQSTPFNDLYPERRKAILFGHKRRAPAGCFPLAIAKIMTYFKCPTTYNTGGYIVDWDALNSSNYSSAGVQSAAHLLRYIADGCNCLYFYKGSFTWPWRATRYMNSIGFRDAHSKGYKWDRAVNMLDKGAPFVIYGMPGIAFWKSHAWNIDGYKVKERTITTNKYYNDRLLSSTSTTETSKMVHCCFGWGGDCDGYYVSGVFNTNDKDVEYDASIHYNDEKFNVLLHIVAYDKPF